MSVLLLGTGAFACLVICVEIVYDTINSTRLLYLLGIRYTPIIHII